MNAPGVRNMRQNVAPSVLLGVLTVSSRRDIFVRGMGQFGRPMGGMAKRAAFGTCLVISGAAAAAGCDDTAERAPLLDAAADALLDGAGPDGFADPDAAPMPVEIVFAAKVGQRPFACGNSYTGVGTEDATVTPADLRFYVQDIELIDDAGRAVPLVMPSRPPWQQERVALLDFENKLGACGNGTTATNDRVFGQIRPGTYRGLRFVVGVPFDLNHQPLTSSVAPLDLTALFWSWNLGHLFMKAEVAPVAAADAGASDGGVHDGGGGDGVHHQASALFGLHVGSTMCEGKASEGLLTACGRPNRAQVALPAFTIGQHRVVVDLGALLSGSNVQAERSCHSFANTPSCGALFTRAGLDYNTGAPSPATQTLFSME